MDYKGAYGLYDDLEKINGLISDIRGKLNVQTLASDVVTLSSLDTKYFVNLTTNMAKTKEQLDNLISSLKHVEECVENGKYWLCGGDE